MSDSPEHLSDAQRARLALMRTNVLARLQLLAEEARASAFSTGSRVTQPAEVQRLQRRVREVTRRWAPRWRSHAAAQGSGGVNHLEHVVPVVVLTERILLGSAIEDVLAQSVLWWVTYEEHKQVLEVAFRRRHAELYKQMLACPIRQLSDLGWQRYRLVGLDGCHQLAATPRPEA